MEMTENNIRSFRMDFMKAVSDLEEQYGVMVSLGNVSYSDEQFSCKLTVTNGRNPEEVARNTFDFDVWRFADMGLRPGMYNRIFVGTDGEKYAIRGFKANAKKYPLRIVRISDGEHRVCSRNLVREWLDEYYVDAIQH